MKFLLTILLAILGQGLGAWNIKNIAKNNVKLTFLSTFSCILIQQITLFSIYTTKDKLGILAYGIGSTIGITGSVWISKKIEK